jgi:hypothetical protein
MTDAIWLGEVFITDLNENDFYDPKEDLVTDLSGKTLSPKDASRKLKSILKTVGAKEWKDLSLFWTEDYLSSFREAARLSRLGEVTETDDLLSQAKDASGNLPIQFDQKKADRLKKECDSGQSTWGWPRPSALKKTTIGMMCSRR